VALRVPLVPNPLLARVNGATAGALHCQGATWSREGHCPSIGQGLPKSSDSVCVWGGEVAEVRSIICPSSVEASVVVVHEPTEAQVLPSQSQETVARSSWKGGKILQSKAT
jgi:hypothetical protein